jgi:hypothetical protein
MRYSDTSSTATKPKHPTAYINTDHSAAPRAAALDGEHVPRLGVVDHHGRDEHRDHE